MIIRKATTIVAIFAAQMSIPANASAQRQEAVAVRYADLDLSTPKGLRVLRQRIAGALEAVCGSYSGTESSSGQAEADEISQCRAANMALVDKRVAAIKSANIRVATAR